MRSGRLTCARKLLFTLLHHRDLPARARRSRRPGVNVGQRAGLPRRSVENDGLYGLINLFSGGALLQLTIFALGIMPYITASIILQLLTVVIPRLEALKKEGQAGQAKITQYTRYLTLGLAILQATGIVALARIAASCSRAAPSDLLSDDEHLRPSWSWSSP